MPVTRIVFVDDHPVVRSGLRLIIGADPSLVVVGEAGSCVEACVLGCNLCPDIVVMDVRLPDGDGIDAAIKIKENSPKTSVLMMTANPGDETIYRALQAGAHGILMKEQAGESLIAAIQDIAAGRRYMSPGAAAILMRHGPRVTLTQREREILQAMSTGLQDKDIGKSLKISTATVRTHVEKIREKFGCRNRQSTVALATARGFL